MPRPQKFRHVLPLLGDISSFRRTRITCPPGPPWRPRARGARSIQRKSESSERTLRGASSFKEYCSRSSQRLHAQIGSSSSSMAVPCIATPESSQRVEDRVDQIAGAERLAAGVSGVGEQRAAPAPREGRLVGARELAKVQRLR